MFTFTLINRSFYYSILTTFRYKNNLVLFIIFITIAVVGLILYVKPLTAFFEFKTLNLFQLFTCIATGFIAVIWFEIVKLVKRSNTKTDRQDMALQYG